MHDEPIFSGRESKFADNTDKKKERKKELRQLLSELNK